MKARIIGTPCEVEVIPYFPEGMFAGFTDVSGTLQPGMVVYKSSQLEFLETPPKLKPEVDWDAFRRETAKDVMCAVLSVPGMWTDTTYEGLAAACIKQVDELIERLTRPFDPTGENGADGMEVYRQWESDLLQSATALVDSVEKYVRQECSRSTLLAVKDNLKKLLEK